MAYIGELRTETVRVIATAKDYKQRHGKHMAVAALVSLAREEDASVGAVLVAVLGLGRSPQGQPVKLSDSCATVEVTDVDTRVALRMHGRRRIRCELLGPYRPW